MLYKGHVDIYSFRKDLIPMVNHINDKDEKLKNLFSLLHEVQ